METVRIATRQSQLALWQANFIAAELKRLYPSLSVELVPMSTQGDREQQVRLADVGGKGLFVKELERALLLGEAELAVHSIKDLPARLPDGFVLGAIGYRADVRDAFISRGGDPLAALPAGSRVGTSSERRAVQLRLLREDIEIGAIRGNVDTRLAKLDAGDFDAILLAGAGLSRLGLDGRVTEYFETDQMLPAAGQGALGIECLAANEPVRELLSALHDPIAGARVAAERLVCEGLGATCTTPLGVFADAGAGSEDHLRLRAMLAMPDGSRVLRSKVEGALADAPDIAQAAVAELQARGADEVMDALR